MGGTGEFAQKIGVKKVVKKKTVKDAGKVVVKGAGKDAAKGAAKGAAKDTTKEEATRAAEKKMEDEIKRLRDQISNMQKKIDAGGEEAKAAQKEKAALEKELAEQAEKLASSEQETLINKNMAGSITLEELEATMKKLLEGKELNKGIEKETKSKLGTFQKIGLAYIGYEVLVGTCLQSEDECKQKCKKRENSSNPGGGVLSSLTGTACEDLKDPNCPTDTPDKDCLAYCKQACTQDQRILRAQCLVNANPAGALVRVLPNLAKTPLSIWDNFKWLIIGIPLVIFALIFVPMIINMFSGARTAAKTVGENIGTGAIQSIETKAMKKFNKTGGRRKYKYKSR